LRGRLAFKAVYQSRVRKSSGPVLFCGLPNGRTYWRLGVSVPRRVGSAVQRNRIKRLLREAFRLSQHDWPEGYDLLIIVRPHEPLKLAEYQRLLSQAMQSIHRKCGARQAMNPSTAVEKIKSARKR